MRVSRKMGTLTARVRRRTSALDTVTIAVTGPTHMACTGGTLPVGFHPTGDGMGAWITDAILNMVLMRIDVTKTMPIKRFLITRDAAMSRKAILSRQI